MKNKTDYFKYYACPEELKSIKYGKVRKAFTEEYDERLEWDEWLIKSIANDYKKFLRCTGYRAFNFKTKEGRMAFIKVLAFFFMLGYSQRESDGA